MAEIKSAFVVRAPADFRRAFLLYTSLFFVGFYAASLCWRRLGLAGDPMLLAIMHALAGMGFILMISVRDPLRDLMIFSDFAIGVLLGCVAMALLALPDYQKLERRRLTFLPLVGSLTLSALLILFGTGPAALAAAVGAFALLTVLWFLLPLFLQQLRGLSALDSGLTTLPSIKARSQRARSDAEA